MSFLYPKMLFGLFALAIPIIIHLFNFRRHKLVLFSNTALLKNIEQENAKTKRIKYLVVLVARMTIIASLVLAFAYPYRPSQKTLPLDNNSLVAVYIDNSLSMQCQSENNSLLEDARSSARALVRNMRPSQRFVLLTNARQLDDEYPMNQDEMLLRIDAMQTESSPSSFNSVLQNLQMIVNRFGFNAASLFIFSDFQRSFLNEEMHMPFIADSMINIVACPLHSDYQQNVYVDSVWLSSPILQPGLPNEINALIVNDGNREINGMPVSLEINGTVSSLSPVNVPAYGNAVATLQIAPDIPSAQPACVSISDSPVTFDDKYYIMLNVSPQIKVVELLDNEDSKNPLKTLFEGDPMFQYIGVDPYHIDQQFLNDCHLIVVDGDANVTESLWQTILACANNGSSVLLLPPDSDYQNDTLFANVISSQHHFFDDVFQKIPDNAEYPMVYRYSTIKKSKYNSLTLIGLQNGLPLLTMSDVGLGNVFSLSIRLNDSWGNLQNNALFVPLMYKIAMYGAKQSKLSYTIGRDKSLTLNDLTAFTEGDVKIKEANTSFEMIPNVEMRNNKTMLFLSEELPNSGFYYVCKGNDVLIETAWNDSREESLMSFLDAEKVGEILKDNDLNVTSVINNVDFASDSSMDSLIGKSSLWKYFIVISLLAMLIEILVLRFWK
ncbi:MAG: BatA domain-containing protein [Candidatus Limimorpha sp.]